MGYLAARRPIHSADYTEIPFKHAAKHQIPGNTQARTPIYEPDRLKLPDITDEHRALASLASPRATVSRSFVNFKKADFAKQTQEVFGNRVIQQNRDRKGAALQDSCNAPQRLRHSNLKTGVTQRRRASAGHRRSPPLPQSEFQTRSLDPAGSTCNQTRCPVFYNNGSPSRFKWMPLRSLVHLSALLLLVSLPALSQCTYSLTGTTTFDANTTNSVIVVTPSASSCTWVAKSNNTWITISFGQAGTGNGTVGFTVIANNTPLQRTGSISVGTATFTITQAAAQCNYSISPTTATISASGGSGTFNLTSVCSWTAVSSSTDWLSIVGTASGSGNASIQYTVLPNQTGAARTATITVGNQTFTVNQQAQCSFTLNPFSIQAAPSGASGTFTVTSSANTCTWNAASNNPDFITITSGATGTGNGSVGYTVLPNNTANPRSGSINVGSASFSVYQPGGTACAYAFSAPSASFTSTGGTGAFALTTSCAWTATTNAAWISLGLTSGSGNAAITYGVAANSSAQSRSANILIGNQSFTINQAGVACSVMVNPTLIQVPAGGATANIDVTAPDSCVWNATTSASWITLGAATGTASGSVPYTAAANPGSQSRTGTITIANQTVTLTQDGAVCGQALTPTNASLSAAAGTYSFNVATACAYTATTSTGWINIANGASGTGASVVSYSVTANTGPDARTGSITVGSQVFTVSQSGAGCSLTVSPGSSDIDAHGGTGSFAVNATGSCRWQPKIDVGWIHFTYVSVNGTGQVNYTADATDQTGVRVGNIFVADQVFQLRQAARPALQITTAGVLNGASFVAGPVAPGEVITIFGSGIGPVGGASLQLTTDQKSLTSLLAATRVLFDGAAAPLIYVSSTQVSAIVPYAVAGKSSTQMQVEYQGFPSVALSLPVVSTAPALFSLDSSGSGPGAILNQDTSVNSAANPAAKGSVVVLYATGEGQTVPPGVDGKLAVLPLPKPSGTVTVQIGGLDARILYAGGAPGLPAGVMQVNAQVPATAPSGAAPVVLRVGANSSPASVSVFLQ